MDTPSQQPVSPQPLSLLSEQTQTLKQINTNLADILHTQKALLKELTDTREQMDEILADEQDVCLTDIDIPMGRLVNFMVSWAIASIPAGIILTVIFGGIYLLIVVLISFIGRF